MTELNAPSRQSAVPLPSVARPWRIGKPGRAPSHSLSQRFARAMQAATRTGPWQWPRRPLCFITDAHADAAAFVASLHASGGIRRTGTGVRDFELSERGREMLFIIGGDCLDKGPQNLELLRVIQVLRQQTRRVRILAGNHDMRLLLGLRCLQSPGDPRTDHFFIRMSPKAMALLAEVHQQYLGGTTPGPEIPDADECRRRMMPATDWFERFPPLAEWVMPAHSIDKETGKMRRKIERFESVCAAHGMDLRSAYAAARKAEQLFLHKGGEFHWFFSHMRLAHQAGSFLFIHAGIDDRIAALLEEKGLRHLNRLFRRQMRGDLFEFYYGPVANGLRTKYRKVDMPLTVNGVQRMHRQGIKAIVHGHRNRLDGQRLMLRQGLLHIECDTTMDIHSRRKENLPGSGAGLTLFLPDGEVHGISTDYPSIKLFKPDCSHA